MNHTLTRLLVDCTPATNNSILTGNWGALINKGYLYIDSIIKESFRNLLEPDRIRYVGYARATFEEELSVVSGMRDSAKEKGNKWEKFDIGNTNMVMYKYIFEVDQTRVILPVYLPYCENDSNIIEISGNKYQVSPIMTDRIISPKATEVFVKMRKCKLTYKSVAQAMYINDQRNTYNLVYVELNKTDLSKPVKILGNVKQLVTISIFCKYGVKEAFRKYLGLNYGEDYKIMRISDIEEGVVTLDTENYNIVSNTSSKEYENDVVVLVKKSVELNTYVMNYICGILYTTKHLYNNYPYLIDRIENDDLEREIALWRPIYIIISFKGDKDFDAATSAGNKMFNVTIPTYVTLDEARELSAISKLPIIDYYDIANYIVKSYEDYINNFREYNNNIDNKYLDILYYMYYDIIYVFNKLVDELNKYAGVADLDKKGRELLKKNLSLKSIIRHFSGSIKCLAISLCDNTLDNKYFKVTSMLEDQNNGSGVLKKFNKADKLNIKDFIINPNNMLIGSILYLGKKKKNSAKYRANIFMSLNGLDIEITPEEKEKINKLRSMLTTTTVTSDELIDMLNIDDESDDMVKAIEIDDDDIDVDTAEDADE